MNIISIIKEKVKRLYLKQRYNNETFCTYLRSLGVVVGENTIFFSPQTAVVDVTRPYLLKIGKGVKIAANVTILTHDFSLSVLRPVYHYLFNECKGYTEISDNVFIGMNSSIMLGCHIGKNCIIGTGSVVTKDIPDNCVVAGNPARVISSLSEFYNRKKKEVVQDAFRLANIIRKEKGRKPFPQEVGFPFLYLQRDIDLLKDSWPNMKVSGDNINEVIEDFFNTTPVFDSFESFLEESLMHKDEILPTDI